MSKLAIGDKVRFTGKFLANTGQQRGAAGLHRWEVLGFWPGSTTMVYVNEPLDTSVGYEDIAPADRPKWRSIAACNLQKVGTLSARNEP